MDTKTHIVNALDECHGDLCGPGLDGFDGLDRRRRKGQGKHDAALVGIACQRAIAVSAIMYVMAITDYIGTTEAAERCGVDRTTFFRWVQLQQIAPALKLPGATGAMLFDPADVDALAESKRAAKKAS